jgi:betaine-aldehyde dehydrogenase
MWGAGKGADRDGDTAEIAARSGPRIWTQDLDRAHRLAGRLQAGYIWINDAATHHVGMPFGGYKQSGMGREESIDEMLACTQIKNINVTFKPRAT